MHYDFTGGRVSDCLRNVPPLYQTRSILNKFVSWIGPSGTGTSSSSAHIVNPWATEIVIFFCLSYINVTYSELQPLWLQLKERFSTIGNVLNKLCNRLRIVKTRQIIILIGIHSADWESDVWWDLYLGLYLI